MSLRVLMVCFEFTPSCGASVQRIMSIYTHFVSIGWEVDVVTVSEGAYERTLTEYDPPEISSHGKIIRCPALDVMKHLCVKGKHPGFLVKPDRWGATWFPTGKHYGAKRIKEKKPDVIWSSSPIPTTHRLAKYFKTLCDALWIADYRDPMSHLQGGAKSSLIPLLKSIDLETVKCADILTFATDEIKAVYEREYPELNLHKKSYTIKNGYVEKVFKKIEALNATSKPKNEKEITLYYAGVLYENGRDPSCLFQAMAAYPKSVKLRFQGAGNGAEYLDTIKALGLEGQVSFEPGVSFEEAISNMLDSTALVLIQGERFKAQIPGKLYEYLRSFKPILLISPITSATSNEALAFSGVFQANSAEEIAASIHKIDEGIKSYNDRSLNEFSREGQAIKLQHIIENSLTKKDFA